tara:strand:- start:190 stop:486 length:297 start_codon:yes stop_codon:yes gene_type:complete
MLSFLILGQVYFIYSLSLFPKLLTTFFYFLNYSFNILTFRSFLNNIEILQDDDMENEDNVGEEDNDGEEDDGSSNDEESEREDIDENYEVLEDEENNE